MRIAICDDDKDILDILYLWIKEYDANCHTTVFSSADELLDYLNDSSNTVDLLICDIMLGDYNGISISESLKIMRPYIQIIFISGVFENRIDVYRVDHIYFLPKPLDKGLLFDALDKSRGYIDKFRAASITIKHSNGVMSLMLYEILYFEQQRRLLYIYWGANEIYTYKKLSDVMPQLDNRFVRCHKSYAVNMDRVRKVEGSELVLFSNVRIPISRTYYKNTKLLFQHYLGGRI